MANAPVWVRQVLKRWNPRIERWLSSLGEGVTLGGTPQLLGCGHYGCAYQLVRPSTFVEAPWVLKVTRDPTEGPMCDFIRGMQENGMLRGSFARMLAVGKINEAITHRGKSWPVYLIVREEVRPGAPWSPKERGSASGEDFRNLQSAARALVKPRKRGRPTVSVWSRAADGFEGSRRVDADQLWWDTIWKLQSSPGFSAIGSDLEFLREPPHHMLLLDVHGNNVGERLHDQDWGDGNEEGTNVGEYVIFDPGHTPTDDRTGKPIDVLTLENPPCLV